MQHAYEFAVVMTHSSGLQQCSVLRQVRVLWWGDPGPGTLLYVWPGDNRDAVRFGLRCSPRQGPFLAAVVCMHAPQACTAQAEPRAGKDVVAAAKRGGWGL
jgi:hypothetical protein